MRYFPITLAALGLVACASVVEAASEGDPERGAGLVTPCATCHQADGSGAPPAFPALKGSPIATGDMTAHIDIVVNGKSGTAMQAFGNQLSEVDLAAVITYERNAWGNNTGDMVTPKEIFDYKNQQ